ncbi:MAG TPA: glycosyltransferase family 9 protein [Candidatus Acidoferrales bacterium]|nr:glycosyltransferase family 9 protein [Candidatus Acidoferrales bacterium]
MAEERFLLVRLGSLGDVIFTLPAVAALRQSFPSAQIDWLIDRRWLALVAGNPHVTNVIELRDRAAATYIQCARKLRERRYSCAIDIQGLYKSALLARISGAPRRIGFMREFVREAGAAALYTERIAPREPHMVGQNMELAIAAGATRIPAQFPLQVSGEAKRKVDTLLNNQRTNQFAVFSPGGGWRSKCWPAERFGEVAARVTREFGLRCLVNAGPGEEEMARVAAKSSEGVLQELPAIPLDQLMAMLRRASLVVAADSGPLHLAVALGTPVVGLFGPTNPARNGPYRPDDIVVRNAGAAETTYKRRDAYSPAMLSITTEQVVDAIGRRLSVAATKR